MPERARRRRGRPYKIQEVIKRRQIMLVQVVKEERGNKGAALTTYLSLAGRYCVLMPNTARGGGISRKITQPTDRKRLQEIAGELEVPEGMGADHPHRRREAHQDRDQARLRLSAAAVGDRPRPHAEIDRAGLVYEEGSLIKRSIRDLYNKDIDEVLVDGDDGYREAKDFMRMLMPSHAKNVKPYKEPTPLFSAIRSSAQLDRDVLAARACCKSGGYIVINQTEALVAIDVNSGRATREHNIEDTALKTNLEAAEEVARQLRLRDLAGLIVIDFIDMEERRNNRLVEKRLKESLTNDRARIQVGRISHFGLLEMSRQRLRTGVLEGSTSSCPMCQGTGIVRSIESVALDVLRSLEDRLITDGVVPLVATTAVDVALYILNQKRSHLKDIEQRYRIPITVTADENLHVSQFVIERSAESEMGAGESTVVQMDWAHHQPSPAPAAPAESEGDQAKRRSRRRRRKRRGPGESGVRAGRGRNRLYRKLAMRTRKSRSARPRPGSRERRESPERRNPPRMAARTASPAAEGGAEDVAAEVKVSVRKVASGKARRVAPRPRRATLAMRSVPRDESPGAAEWEWTSRPRGHFAP